MVRDSGDALLVLINDILDFSKIEAGKLEFQDAAFALRENLGETLKTLALRAEEKDLDLACRIDPGVPNQLVGDMGRLRQVVVNLVGNAIKFTEQGEVVLEVCRHDTGELPDGAGASPPEGEGSATGPGSGATNGVWLHFSVRDTGIGIPEEKRDTIFDVFEQADNSRTRRYGGTGLGLAISTRLVQHMRGRLWLESEVGRGSTFHFTAHFGLGSSDVPVAEAERRRTPESEAVAPPQSAGALRILLAEDSLFNQKLAVGLLKKHGHTIVVANHGKEALSAWRSQGFDLVLMDVQMPEMDGFETTAAIRSEEKETGQRIPIIAMTAHAMKGDRQRCLEAGMDGYVAKPIHADQLLEAIEAAIEPHSPSRQAGWGIRDRVKQSN
jgi:CheY-like chemotaxis protein